MEENNPVTMSILLVYLNIDIPQNRRFSFGLGSIGSYLKSLGHEVYISVASRHSDIEKIIQKVRHDSPILVGFSAVTDQFRYVEEFASTVKAANPNVITVCGGIHPTISPESLMDAPHIDFLVRGEGEQALEDLIACITNGKDPTGIHNLVWRETGGIHINALRPLVADLDALPPPLREGFEDIHDDGMYREAYFNFSRGCPFECTYCSNKALKDLYPGKYVRIRSVEEALRKIEGVLRRDSDIHCLRFEDDVLTINRKWIREFLKRYRENFAIPFSCNVRVDCCPGDILQQMAESGCFLVSAGIESGDERIRFEIFKRRITDEQIIGFFDRAHSLGLKTASFNMIGIPGENPVNFEKTIDMNARIYPNIPWLCFFHPYPGTELWDYCKKNNLFKNEAFKFQERMGSVLDLPGFPPKRMNYLFRNFRYLILRKVSLKSALWFRVKQSIPEPLKIPVRKTKGLISKGRKNHTSHRSLSALAT
jgi:anaerobic magnesium-protoporphyrin IX monomethyl ester cyclase